MTRKYTYSVPALVRGTAGNCLQTVCLQCAFFLHRHVKQSGLCPNALDIAAVNICGVGRGCVVHENQFRYSFMLISNNFYQRTLNRPLQSYSVGFGHLRSAPVLWNRPAYRSPDSPSLPWEWLSQHSSCSSWQQAGRETKKITVFDNCLRTVSLGLGSFTNLDFSGVSSDWQLQDTASPPSHPPPDKSQFPCCVRTLFVYIYRC